VIYELVALEGTLAATTAAISFKSQWNFLAGLTSVQAHAGGQAIMGSACAARRHMPAETVSRIVCSLC